MYETDDTTWIGYTPIGYARIDNDPTFGVWLYVEGSDEGWGPFDDEQGAEDQLWALVDEAPPALLGEV